jgi:hypothetical protein
MRCKSGCLVSLIAGLLLSLLSPSPALAQLVTQHVKGSAGLKSGSQPPPGSYFIAPVLYFYSTDTVKNRNGDTLPTTADITSGFFGVGYNHVTTKKLLGGLYGFTVLFPAFANNRIQGTEIERNPGAGITDSVVQPISLGWHLKRADVLTYYTIYVPTGRYTNGASNNTGLGMWGNELGIGTTVYLTKSKQFHAATLASFNVQSKKEDSDTKVGNQMNLEGGVGADFLKGGLTTGLVYYAAFKLTEDQIGNFPGVLLGKNRVFAFGPEATLAIARKDVVYGFVKVNYQWEVYARTTTQGGAWNIAATFLLKPLHVGKP